MLRAARAKCGSAAPRGASRLALAAVLVVAAPVAAGPAGTSPASSDDAPTPQAALSWTASALAVEAQVGALAESRGASDRVRRFGRLLRGDAALAAHVLEGAASRTKSTLPPPEHLEGELRGELEGRRGADFDRAILAVARGVAARALSVLVQVSPAVSDGAARDALRKVEPLLEQHLRLAVILERSE